MEARRRSHREWTLLGGEVVTYLRGPCTQSCIANSTTEGCVVRSVRYALACRVIPDTKDRTAAELFDHSCPESHDKLKHIGHCSCYSYCSTESLEGGTPSPWATWITNHLQDVEDLISLLLTAYFLLLSASLIQYQNQ